MICPTFTEEAVLNPPRGMEGWRKFRIEYGFEGHGLPEGGVWLPPDARWIDLEEYLRTMCAQP